MAAISDFLGNIIGEDGIKTEVGLNQPDVNYAIQKLTRLVIVIFVLIVAVILIVALLKRN